MLVAEGKNIIYSWENSLVFCCRVLSKLGFANWVALDFFESCCDSKTLNPKP